MNMQQISEVQEIKTDNGIIRIFDQEELWLQSFYHAVDDGMDPSEFDDMDEEDKWSEKLFKVKDWWHTLDDFVRLDEHTVFAGWHASKGDSFFSGILLKIIEAGPCAGDKVIAARYTC